MEDLQQKAEQYKAELQKLNNQKQEIERQLIILEEQYSQYKEKIEQAFQTSDINELKKISEGYISDIEKLEEELNALS
jgi:uncharacterized coiled-coil DUF342 family protein